MRGDLALSGDSASRGVIEWGASTLTGRSDACGVFDRGIDGGYFSVAERRLHERGDRQVVEILLPAATISRRRRGSSR